MPYIGTRYGLVLNAQASVLWHIENITKKATPIELLSSVSSIASAHEVNVPLWLRIVF